ncbi:MAG: glycosyltransferase [Eubacterium sp.]|nr:glycosyltransferase [Eubacterium sp.]
MKILYVQILKGIRDFLWGLVEAGYDVSEVECPEMDPNFESGEGLKIIAQALDENDFDMVVAQAFLPGVSDLCEERGIYFLSWTYDSPLTAFYCESLKNQHNITFAFDKREAEGLSARGGANVYHMPLACNLSRVGALEIVEGDEEKYGAEVSFVGSLYSENFYDLVIAQLPDAERDELKMTLFPQVCNYHKEKVWPRISDKLFDALEDVIANNFFRSFDMDLKTYIGLNIYVHKLAQVDRVTALNALAAHFDTSLFTNKGSEYLTNVRVRPFVDYYSEMSKVFYLSRINLNLTNPSIRTGIPQRIFDVMGCGGFMLTNYQPEIEEQFEIGKEIEVFYDVDDLIKKTEYYLGHERERLEISLNGYKAIRDRHSMAGRVGRIMEIAQSVIKGNSEE